MTAPNSNLTNDHAHRADTRNPAWDQYVPEGHGRTDEQIRADIHELLMKEDGHRTSSFAVSVAESVATLSGRVQGHTERLRLRALVRHVPSVKDVVDQLTVDPAPAPDRMRAAAPAVEPAERGEPAGARAQDLMARVESRGQRVIARLGERAARSGKAVGRFASVHALPLSMLGASLGYLFWSLRREARLQRELHEFEIIPYEPLGMYSTNNQF